MKAHSRPSLIVDVVQAAFQAPWIDLYEGFDLEEDTQINCIAAKLW
jgi:hypothetical protein